MRLQLGGVSERRSRDMMIKQESSQDEALHASYVLYTWFHTCFIRGFIRRLILRAIVHKKENHGSIVVGESRKFTSSFLTLFHTKKNKKTYIINIKTTKLK